MSCRGGGAKFQYTDFEGGQVFSAPISRGGQVLSAPESRNSSAPPVPINNDRSLMETLGPMFGFKVPKIFKLCPAGGLRGPRPPFPIILLRAARYDLCVMKKTHSNQFSELGMSESIVNHLM